ncbi:MAG: N-acetyltransferase [Bacteroidales bacterium]|jgi:ribosomal protein S18 acetylase RimI-like enzyme|nr:N-acetyltransferase [Bacteroidales bacterium]
METPQLRKAQLSDLDKIMAIEGQSFNEEAFSRGQMRYLLTSDNTFLVAEMQQQVVATMILLSKKKSKVLRIYGLAVSNKFRGKGLGKAMLVEAINVATAGNYGVLSLEVKSVNNTAIKLYESFGFKAVKELPHYFKGGYTAQRMQLKL